MASNFLSSAVIPGMACLAVHKNFVARPGNPKKERKKFSRGIQVQLPR
jgi:hypothetical protein